MSADAAESTAPLPRTELRCQALIEATEAIVWTVDPEGAFIEPQASWQAYTSQSWEQARGRGWLGAVHPDDRPQLLEAWTAAVHRGTNYHASYRLWHAASYGWRRVVVRATPLRDAQGRVVEWVGAVTDVQDRPLSLPELQRLNDALARQLQTHHEALEQLFNVSLDIMLTLGPDGRLQTVSPSFETVAGVPAAEASGQVFDRYVHPDDRERTWNEVRQVLTGDHQAIDFETRLVRPDGTERVVSWRAVGSRGEARVYAVGRDVTERNAAERRQLRAQRLEAVGQLTGGIAHDFNNILAAVMSYLEVARRQREPAALVGTLQAAAHAVRRGAALVAQLLTFARRQELALGPTDLNDVVVEMRELLARTLGGTVAVTVEPWPALPPVLADRTQLEAALLNLCINARDAMPQGGRLVIRTAPHTIGDDPASRYDDLPKGDYALLTVEDSGTGMDEHTLARCFEPFFTTKGTGQGTGLGLAQVLGVVQQCGGTVVIHSRPGAGTTVHVVLPQACNAVPAATGGSLRAGPPTLPAGTVLVVDDDADVLGSTTALLQALGFVAIAAAGPEEAMSVVMSGRPFDVLLTDYAMPGMTGAQLVRDAQRHRPKLVAVLATGFADLAPLGEELPAASVLRKPFEPDQLVAAIEAAIAAHHLKTGER